LVEQITETETPLPEVFGLLRGLLEALGRQPPQPRTVLAFELKFLTLMGLAPDLDRTRLSPEARSLLTALTREDWPAIAALKTTPARAAEALDFLRGFLPLHLDRVPNGRDAALKPE
jgi:recombinational DNA repair protein (RecF pathway)